MNTITMRQVETLAASTLGEVNPSTLWRVLRNKAIAGEQIDSHVTVAITAGALRLTPAKARDFIAAVKRTVPTA